MAIMLGTHEFGERVTAVRERLREVGGRDAREIVIEGVVEGLASVAEVEAALDAILESASDSAADVPLSIRDGRQLLVRRVDFKREVQRVAVAGAFELVLEARDPVECAVSETVLTHTFPSTGMTFDVTAGGNAGTPLHATLTPDADVTRPLLSDGTRTLVYDGVVPSGMALVLDGEAGRVWLDGEDVTPYTEGALPRLEPGDNTLTYAHEPSGVLNMDLLLRFRDRWW